MRQSLASFAHICREIDGQTRWLAQWNGRWKCYNFVGGHKHAGETFRECLVREVAEELGLAPGVDFEAAPKPLAHAQYEAWSAGAKEQTTYTVELFHVELLGAQSQTKIAQLAANRWLTRAEIAAQATSHGQPISDTMQRMLAAAGWPEAKNTSAPQNAL